MNSPGRTVAVAQVRPDGLVLSGTGDFPVDVCFDGRRIFSFWLHRDTQGLADGRFLPWPDALRRFLEGETTLSLVDPATGEAWTSIPMRLGAGTERIAVVDPAGNPLGLDKSGRLMRLFGERSDAHLAPLLDSIGTVLESLEAAGVQPFLAYGTLLGAVREQNFIGHDSDADVGYVSTFDHPVDVTMESFRIQRRLQEMGLEIQRYSGLAFKVVVRESDGKLRGLDVFGGFMRADTLYLMGEVGHRFHAEWLWPRSEVQLAGRTFPAPAQPDRLLEAMYGEHWRVPDPAYRFETSTATARRLTGWFRGTRVGLDERWARRRGQRVVPDLAPSDFAAWVRREEPTATRFVDVGCGFGGDALWYAGSGASAIGLDYMARDIRRAQRIARRQGVDAVYDWVSLTELRSVLATGAWLARQPGPRIVTARHVADATDATGRRGLLRLARMATRAGGRLYLQVQTRPSPRNAELEVTPLRLDALLELVAESGGTVLSQAMLSDPLDPAGAAEPGLCRMVVSWER